MTEPVIGKVNVVMPDDTTVELQTFDGVPRQIHGYNIVNQDGTWRAVAVTD
jgi:hypothetical protein